MWKTLALLLFFFAHEGKSIPNSGCFVISWTKAYCTSIVSLFARLCKGGLKVQRLLDSQQELIADRCISEASRSTAHTTL